MCAYDALWNLKLRSRSTPRHVHAHNSQLKHTTRAPVYHAPITPTTNIEREYTHTMTTSKIIDEKHLDWSAKQGRILTDRGNALKYFSSFLNEVSGGGIMHLLSLLIHGPCL